MKLLRFMQRQKGTISIFMAVIMLSMFVLTSVFVDGSRLRSAETIVQSASDSAIRSVTAKYDKELKERYGLFTLEETNPEAIRQDYLDFFAANVAASLPGAEDSFHKYLDQIMAYVSGEADQDALDLFDFQVAESSVNPAYSIIEPDVLQKQMVEYAKYRSAFAIADLFDIGGNIRDSIKKAKVDTQNVKKTLSYREKVEDVMADTDEWAKDLQDKKKYFDSHRAEWREDIHLTETRMGDLEEVMAEIAEVYERIAEEEAKEDGGDTAALRARLEELKQEAREIYSPSNLSLQYDKEKKIDPMLQDLEKLQAELKEELKKAQPFITRIIQARAEVKASINSMDKSGTESVLDNLEFDAEEMMVELDTLKKVVEADKEWLEQMIERLETGIKNLKKISEGITPSLAEAESEGAARQNESKLKALQKDAGAAEDSLKKESGKVDRYQYKNIFKDLAEKLNALYNVLRKNSNLKTTNELENPAKISDTSKKSLPSVLYKKDETYHTNEKYAEMDKNYTELKESAGVFSDATNVALEEINADDAEKSLNLIESFLGIMGDMATDATNAVVTDLYTMSMFKARTTKTTGYWKDVYAKSMIKPDNEPFDRERSTKEDRNLRLIEKAAYSKENGKSFMDAELEYIVVGAMDEKANANSVYARIFGIRMGLNTIAVLADRNLSQLSTAAASVTGPLAPVVKVAILLVLALVETYLDMYFLIDKGYKVALLKNNGCLTLSLDNLRKILQNIDFDNMQGIELFSIFAPGHKQGAIMIDYETYIYFLLLLVNRETKLLRMADIIQLNMQVETNDMEYHMADHYTALRAETEATIKPMMMSLPFVPGDMKRDGRYSVKTMIYEGY